VVIGALDRKLIRDLWGMKGQALAIALVISSGVATFIMSRSTLDSLRLTQAVYYRDFRFAEVFASLKRAPESVKPRIAAIEGVQQVQTRVIAAASLDLPGFPDPVTAQIVSVPDHGQPLLNRLFLRRGRMVQSGRDNEVVISDAFAAAHNFQPGDRLSATIRGKRKRLEIVGIALSPEFIYQLQPGAIIPDFRTYGILWMARTPLENANEMEGGFNDLSLELARGASVETVIDQVDDLLARYGGLGAISRKDQMSHRFLSEEFRQLQQMATVFPVIFLSVAAFLLNVVITRLIATQREQVAILKAFGYSTADVVLHYLKFVVLIVLAGVAGGIAFGVWLAQGLVSMYMDFYRFPFVLYQLRPAVAVTAALVTAGAAIAGSVYSVLRAAGVPPAEAMQPAAPPRYRSSILERMGFGRGFAQPTRMIVRNIERRPVKALLSVIGIGFACAILVLGGFYSDCFDYMVAVQFRFAQRDDITLTFVEPTSVKAMFGLQRMPGVGLVEPYRSVPARLRFAHRTYRAGVRGIPAGNTLYRLLDTKLESIEMPPEGVVLTDYLAGILGVRPGDSLTIEVLEGERPVRQVPVVGVVREFIGLSAYMRLDALNRLMREGPSISGVYMTADGPARPRILEELKGMPRVAGASMRENALKNFYEIMARQTLIFAFINTILAATIAVGVVYNTARIALSERNRELASLRVLGFTRGEISYILLGELAVLTLLSIPLGFLLGRALCNIMAAGLQNELFRIPLIVNADTYAFAATVVLVSGLLSGLAVRRKLDHLDLVAVLKSRE
jgi:putative ABC transport system permease protein